MGYKKLHKTEIEFQSESLTKSITRSSENIWEDNEIGTYELVDSEGNTIATGNLLKSSDKKTLTAHIGYSVTSSLSGKYMLLMFLEDSNDSTFRDVIAQYDITYQEKKAQ